MKAFKLSVLPLTQTFFAIIVIVVVAYLALAYSKSKVGSDTYANDNRQDWQVDFATKDDSKSLIQGELTVAGDNNNIGGSWMPHQNGNIYVRPQEAAKEVYIGDINTKSTSIGSAADVQYNRVGHQSWFPYVDGNTYIRPGRANHEVKIGDWWTGGTRLGTGGDVKFNQVGPHTWLPYTDGNSYIRPGLENYEVRIGDWWTGGTRLGTGDAVKFNQIGPHTWLPYVDGNSYIRPGADNRSVVIGDHWTNSILMGKGDNTTNTYVRGNLNANKTISAQEQLCIDGECINKAQLASLRNKA